MIDTIGIQVFYNTMLDKKRIIHNIHMYILYIYNVYMYYNTQHILDNRICIYYRYIPVPDPMAPRKSAITVSRPIHIPIIYMTYNIYDI